MKRVVVASVVAVMLAACSSGIAQEEYDGIVERAEEAESRTAELESELDALSDEVSGFESALEARKGEVGTLQSELAAEQELRAEVEGEIAQLEDEIAQLEDERDVAQRQAEQLTQEMNDLRLAFDDDIQAARTELAANIVQIGCDEINASGERISAQGVITGAAETSLEVAAALEEFDIETIINLDEVNAQLENCYEQVQLRSPKGSGFYTVGVEIAPGTWRSTGSGDSCYWARLTQDQGILDNHYGSAGGSVTIRSSDYEVEFDDCGTWEYQR